MFNDLHIITYEDLLAKDHRVIMCLTIRGDNMPYKSDQQRKWAHTKKGTKSLGGKAKVKEWDEASKGRKLPKRIKKGKK